MDALPAEIVEHIIASSPEILGPRDIVNVAMCSKRLYDAVRRSQRIWKGQFRSRFPTLLPSLDKDASVADWRERYVNRVLCERRCAAAIGSFSADFWHCDDIGDSDIRPKMADLVAEFGHEALEDSLRQLNKSWADPENHLTLRYYGLRALEWLQKQRLTVEMRALLENRTSEEDPIIKALAIAAQWFQPEKTVNYGAIKAWLDAAAERALKHLAEKKVFGPGRLSEKRWTTRIEACQVMDAVSQVLFVEMGLKGNADNYYDMRNSYIDEVLERCLGIPIMLSLLFMSAARRVGLTLPPSSLPGHFMLRLEVGDEGEGAEAKDFLYVDAFNGGKAMSCFEVMELVKRLAGNDVSISDECFMAVATPRQIMQRVINNLLRCFSYSSSEKSLIAAFELWEAMKPEGYVDPEGKYDQNTIYLCQMYMRERVNCDRIETIFRNRTKDGQSGCPAVTEIITVANVRQTEIEAMRLRELSNKHCVKPRAVLSARHGDAMGFYGVGMVMRHKRYDYECVIYGWNECCAQSQMWIHQMGVHKLPHAEKQPFYRVLVSDGSERYAAEESLEPIPFDGVPRIDHDMVGRFFCSFDGSRYLPNEELATIYPEDVDHVRDYLRDQSRTVSTEQ